MQYHILVTSFNLEQGMNKVTDEGMSVPPWVGVESPRSLPCGLRELVPTPSTRIFCGMLSISGDTFQLLRTDHPHVLDVYFSCRVDRDLNRRAVSVLGYLGDRVPAALVAIRVVSHEAVSLRAYQLHQSSGNSSAIANWLCAERQLLEC